MGALWITNIPRNKSLGGGGDSLPSTPAAGVQQGEDERPPEGDAEEEYRDVRMMGRGLMCRVIKRVTNGKKKREAETKD